MYAHLTDDQLETLERRSFSGLSRMYATAETLFTSLHAITDNDLYMAEWHRASDILDTARESHELHDDVIAERRARRAARQDARERVAALAR